MLKLALAVIALLPFTTPAITVRVSDRNPADSVEFVYSWPQAASPYGPADHYKVQFAQGTDIRVHDPVTGLADSFAILKPACGPTNYPVTVTVWPYYAGAQGTALVVNHVYQRPCPTPAFPAGSVITVDSSKVVRP